MNLALENGQGVKFNGIDQLISIDRDFTFLRTSDWTITLTNTKDIFTNGYDLWLGSIDACLYGNRFAIWTGSQQEIVVFQEIASTRTIVREGSVVSVYENGVLIGTTSDLFVNMNTTLDIGARTGVSYTVGIISDVQFHNQALTPEQIAQQYASPETFLYMENGVVKSDVLVQGEIDNVVCWLPMVETDGYVRDMVNYGENDILDVNTSLLTHSSASVVKNGDSYTVTGDDDTYCYMRLSDSGTSGAYSIDPHAGSAIKYSYKR